MQRCTEQNPPPFFVSVCLNIMKYSLLFLIALFYADVCAQTNIKTANRYQSEYEWIDSNVLKFRFYTYRPVGMSLTGFPDTGYVSLFYQSKRIVDSVLIERDSIFAQSDFYCTGRTLCKTNSGCNNSHFSFSTVRYTGVIDFSAPKIKDSLDKKSACLIDVVLKGGFFPNAYQNFASLWTSAGNLLLSDSQYCYFSINRCFKWEKNDQSAKFRKLDPIDDVFRVRRKGIAQIDFGLLSDIRDSVIYELTQPKFFPPKSFLSFDTGFSLNYYINSYCQSTAPCLPRPELSPPRSFYLNSKTGISLHYNVSSTMSSNNLFCVKIKTFKNNAFNVKELVSEQLRVIDYITARTNDADLNKPVYFENFPLRQYACMNAPDTITFNVKDSTAINQIIPDTIKYSVFHNLPGGSFYESQSYSSYKELKVIWKPDLGKISDNPYLFNLTASEKRCWPNREYEFRSCEFYVVQKPEFTIKKTIQNCGRIELVAEKKVPDNNNYNYAWTLTHTGGTKINAKFSSAVLQLPLVGRWNISLTATNSQHGCKGVFIDSIQVASATPSLVISSKQSVCQNQNIVYKAQYQNLEMPLQYLWQVGSQTSIDSFFERKVLDSFKVKVSITDQNGCFVADSFEQKTFPVYPMQKIADTAVCRGQSIILSAKPVNISDTIVWLHNNSKDISQTLIIAQTYSIAYKDKNACVVIDSFQLKNNDAIIPFSNQDKTVCKGDTLHLLFLKTSSIDYQRIHWLENGVLRSTLNEFKTIVQEAGTVEVSAAGKQYNIVCEEKDTFSLQVYPKNSNKLNVFKSDTCLSTNKFEVNIIGGTSVRNQIINWGDGIIEPYVQKLHQYTQAKVFEITLFSETSNGCRDTQSQMVEVFPNPDIEANLSKDSICLGQGSLLAFKSNALNAEFLVEWGDGDLEKRTGNGSLIHKYKQANYFQILVKINNGICQNDTAIDLIVNPSPIFTLSAIGFCLGDSTFVKAQSNQNLLNFTWIPKGSDPVQQYSETYLFSEAKDYMVKAFANNQYQCMSSDSINIRMIEKPSAAFSYANLSKELKYKFKFINQSKGASGYEWYFTKTGTQISTLESPDILFTDTGLYTVLLIANQDLKCYDTAQKKIPVLEQIVFYFPNVCSINNDGLNETFGLDNAQKPFVLEYQVEVFNRWGEMVFKSDDINTDWRPNDVQLGVYIFTAKVRDVYNVLHEIKGVVEVLR